jgi:hypothetical protein
LVVVEADVNVVKIGETVMFFFFQYLGVASG